MPFEVFLTAASVNDLEEIYNYVELHDSPEKATYLLENIEQAFMSLSQFPERGAHPKELTDLGIHDYREIFFKTYRVIYRIINDNVYVILITDGRRNMQTLLLKRLLQ